MGSDRLKVLRRSTYKGGMRVAHCLPLDSATVPGIVLIVGSVLSFPSLNAEAVASAKSLLQALEDAADLKQISVSLPDGSSLTLDCNSEGRFGLRDLKTVFKKTGHNVFDKLLGRHK